MRNQCIIKNCNNNRLRGFHLFRFPFNRKDHLKKWLEAIGETDLKPTQSDVICSAHFTTNDYMDRPGARDVRLKYLAVPSIFPEDPIITPVITSILAPNVSASKRIPNLSTSIIHSQTMKSKCPKKDKTNCIQSSKKIASTSAVDNTIKITSINRRKIMNKSKYYFKDQKIDLKKKQMQTIITTLKQDLKKNEKTVQFQQNLLAVLEVLNESCNDSSSEGDERMELSPVQAVRPRIKNYMDIINEYSDVEFKNHFRISRVVFTYLLNLIKPNLEKQAGSGRCPIPSDVQLLVALWTMATPDSYRSVCDRFHIGRATAWRANRKVWSAIYFLAAQFIKWPNAEEAECTWMDVEYTHKFPKVLGAIDGTHIRIHKPKEYAENYINRKGYYSVQLQAVCDSNLKFIHCYAEQPGSVHEMCVFQLSGIQSKCTENYFPHNSHLIGDVAYTVQKHLMVPYQKNGHLSKSQINFNQRLCSAHVMIEKAIGYLKGRFCSLLDKLYMKRTDLIPQYIIACCVLHNICILHEDFMDDIVIAEKDDIPVQHDVEINIQDKEEGIKKRNSLTHMLNQSAPFNIFDYIALEHNYPQRPAPKAFAL